MRCVLGVCCVLLCAGGHSGDLTGSVKVLKKGGAEPLSNNAFAVVEVQGLTTPAPAEAAVSEQTDKTFHPRVLVVIVGQPVNFFNRDPIQHNVFSRDERQEFDLGHYPKDSFRQVSFDQPGTYKVYCNIHQRMIQDVVVVENRYFAVTDRSGQFEIRGIPNGKYRVKAWHIHGGEQVQDVAIGDQTAHADFVLESTRYVREVENHPNKEGQAYRKRDDY